MNYPQHLALDSGRPGARPSTLPLAGGSLRKPHTCEGGIAAACILQMGD